MKRNFHIIAIVLSFFCASGQTNAQSRLTILIDPWGDVINPGNRCVGSYERSLTLQCAEHIKKKIESSTPDISIILTRTTGFVRSPYGVMELAHRMNVNLAITLRACLSLDHEPTIYSYVHRSYADTTTGTQTLFIPLERAHITASKQSARYAQDITTYLYNTSVTLQQKPIALPLKPLTGFAIPAFLLELSITQMPDVTVLGDRIADSLLNMYKQHHV